MFLVSFMHFRWIYNDNTVSIFCMIRLVVVADNISFDFILLFRSLYLRNFYISLCYFHSSIMSVTLILGSKFTVMIFSLCCCDEKGIWLNLRLDRSFVREVKPQFRIDEILIQMRSSKCFVCFWCVWIPHLVPTSVLNSAFVWATVSMS